MGAWPHGEKSRRLPPGIWVEGKPSPWYNKTMLFKVTDEALAALLHGRKDEGHPEDQVMRVIWDEDDLAFELDFPDMMDMVYKWEGEPVLLVDPEMNRDFGDMILDVVSQDGTFNFFMTENEPDD